MPTQPHQPILRAAGPARFKPNPQVVVLALAHPLTVDELLALPVDDSDKGQLLEMLGWTLADVQARGFALDVTANKHGSQRHPVQPVVRDHRDVARFHKNSLVRHLLDTGPVDLNDLAMMGGRDVDRVQLAQLIGYSIDGASTLSYMSACVIEEADRRWDALCAKEVADALREGLDEPLAARSAPRI